MMARREDPNLNDAADGPMSRALEWFTLLQDGAAKESDRAVFEAWYGEAPEHRRAYARITALWGAPELTTALARSAADATAQDCIAAVSDAVPAQRRRRSWGVCLSAAAALVLFFGFFGADVVQIFQPAAEFRTEVGESRDIALPDRSMVRLNTASALSTDFGGGARRVSLLNGEGFFDVVRDETRPFVVTAGSTTVRVLGTSFDVYRDGERISVAVKSGEVSVWPNGKGGGEDDIRLAPGDKVEIAPGMMPRVRRVDGDRAFAWLSGRIAFRDARLGDVLIELGRYYDGWIYAVGDIGDVRVSGNFRNDDPAGVARVLARSAGGDVIRLSGDILILR
jgi:transmembrane sensor